MSKNTLCGFYIVVAVIGITNIAILWMLIPGLPASFLVLSLPIKALRVVHSLALSLVALHNLVVPQKIFFWYHFFIALIPFACVVGLFLRKNSARKILLYIACLNGCYWILVAILSIWRSAQNGLSSTSLWQAGANYGPAFIISLLYVIYLNDKELKSIFKDTRPCSS